MRPYYGELPVVSGVSPQEMLDAKRRVMVKREIRKQIQTLNIPKTMRDESGREFNVVISVELFRAD